MELLDILTAVFLGVMFALVLPRARQMLTNSPPAQRGDWQSLLLPLLAVVGFVLLLMKLV